MNPRESLNKILEASIEAGGITNPENITEPFAIGRWVSVEERWPEFDRINGWGGCVLWKDDGKPTFGDWVRPHFNGHYFTHWLDLDMPSGKGEA